MAVSTNRSRISEILGTDSKPKKKPLYGDPNIATTGSRVAQVLGVETPQIAQQELYKPVIGPSTYNWVEEGHINAATPAWQKVLASGPVGGFFNAIQKPLALGSSLAKESIDMATGQGFDFGDLRQQYNENYTFGRLLHDYDLMQNRNSGWQKFGAASVGFLGDVVFDPLTYIGLVGKGAGFAAKLASGGARNLSRKAVGESLKKMTLSHIARTAGDDVARTLGDDVFMQVGDAIASGAAKKAGTKGLRIGNVTIKRGRKGGYQMDVWAREGTEEGTKEVLAGAVKIGDSVADDLTDFYRISSKAQQKGASLIEPDELRRAAGFMARSELDTAGRTVGSKGYRGALLSADEAANLKVGIGFKVPGTGPIGRALRIADPITNAINKVTRRGVSAPVGIRVMTSETPIIGKIAMSLPRGVRRAVNRAGLSKAGKALVGGRMNALKRKLRETNDAVLIQQGKRAIHAVARGTSIGRRAKPVMMSLVNDLAKTIDAVGADPTTVYHALGGDLDAQAALNKIDSDLLPEAQRVVAALRDEANKLGGREFLADTENYVPRQLTDEALDGKRSQRELIEEALEGSGRYNKRVHKRKGERYTPTGPEMRRGYVDSEDFKTAAKAKAATDKISVEEAADILRKDGTLTDHFFGEELHKPGSTVDGEVMGSVEKQIADIIERNGGDYSLFVDDINVALKGWVDQVSPRVGEVATETILTQDGIIIQRLAEYAKFPSAAAVMASKKLNRAEEVWSAATAKVIERAHKFQHAVGEEKALAKQALEEAQRNADLAEDAVDAAVREEAEIFSRQSGLQQEIMGGDAELDDIQRVLDEVEGKIPESEGEELIRLEAERQDLVRKLDRVASNPKRIRYAYETIASGTARKIHIEQQLRSIFGSGENFDEFQRVMSPYDASVPEEFPMEITLPDGSVLNEQQIQDAMGRLEEVLDMEDASGVGLWMGVERDIDILNLGNQANNPANKAAYMLDKINTELDDAVGVAQRYMDVTGEEVVLPTPEAVMEAQETIATVTGEFDQAVQAGDRLPGELTEYLTSNPEVAQALRTYYASGDLPSPTYLPDMGALDGIEQQVGAKIAGRLNELGDEIGARGSQLNLSYVDGNGKEQVLTVRDYVYLRQMRNAIEAQKNTAQLPIGFSRPGIDELDVDWASQAGTNPGGFATDANGNEYYVKRYDEVVDEGGPVPKLDEDGNPVPSVDRAASEVLANAVYRELGFGAPNSYMSVGPGGEAYHIAPLIEDFQTAQLLQTADAAGNLNPNLVTWDNDISDLFVWTDPNTGAQRMGKTPPPNATVYPLSEVVGQGFMADVLLSNWDAMGLGADNIGITPWNLQEASVVRIDNGAAFFNRAQGIPKSGGGWDWRAVSELNDPGRFQTAMVGGMPDAGLQAQQLDHLLMLRARYGGWEGFVKRHAPDLSEDQIRQFSQFLEVRSEVLAETFNKPFLDAGSTDLRKSAYFSQGFGADDIDEAFDGFVGAPDAYGPKQQTAQKEGFPAWMTDDEETQAIGLFSLGLSRYGSAEEKITDAIRLNNVSAVSVERDLEVLLALDTWMNSAGGEIDGLPASYKEIAFRDFEGPDGGLEVTQELSWRDHEDLWGTEVPDNVSYGVVILDDRNNVVLRMPTDGADGEPFGGVKWTFPKGRPDGGETPWEVATREAFEETALDVDIVAPLPGEFQGSTGSTFYFVGRMRPGAQLPNDVMGGVGRAPSVGGAMAPTAGSLAVGRNLEPEQLANVQMVLNHMTREGAPNVWNEYARLAEDMWGDKWGYNMTPGNVAYGAGGDVYKLTANVPQGAENIKIYGLPPREAQLAAQLSLQMGLETNPGKLTSIAERLEAVVSRGKKEMGVGQISDIQRYGMEGLAPMMTDQWARVLDQDSELATILMERMMLNKSIKPQTAEAFTLAKRLGTFKLVADEAVAPEVAVLIDRLASMETGERLDLAINLVEMDLSLEDLLTEDGASEAFAFLKGLDSSTSNYLDNRAEAHLRVREWAVDVDNAFTGAQDDASVYTSLNTSDSYRAKPVEFQASQGSAEERVARLHAQFIDVYKRTLANDGYSMAAWMNRGDAFPSTIPHGPKLGDPTTGAKAPVPNIIAVNPMSFSYDSMAGNIKFGEKFEAFAGAQTTSDFVGAPQYMEDFERMMDAQMVPSPEPLNLEEDALEALVARQSEVLATVESTKAEYSNSVAQLKSAERRLEEAVVDASEKQAHAVVQRQVVSALADQENTVNRALEALNRLGIGEGVSLDDIADDDLIALNQATKILIQSDADMNRLAFSEIEEGADGWFDLISKTAEQRADIHRIGNRETILDDAFHAGWKPMGAIFQGPDRIVDSMQAAERFVARGGAKSFFRKYDKLHNLLRGYMIMKPGFHMRNYFSGVFMNHLAGMDWSNYRRYMRAYWKFQEEEAVRLGMPDKAARMRKQMRARGIDPSNVSAEHVQYVRELAESGTLGGAGAQVATEFVDTSSGAAGKATVRIGGKKINLLAAANPASSQNFLLKLSKNTGMATETFLRGALGFDTLYKGLSPDEAFENVMKFHFDYDDLSDFERNVIKKVVPFYTWTRKNMPLMMEMAARRPAVFNKYNSLKKEMEYGQERPQIVPQWMERQGAIQTPWKYEGESMFILPDLPFKAPMELLDPSLRFTTDESVMDRIQTALGTLGTQITPLIKAPYEWKAKQNLWKGYNFDGGYEVVPRAYAKVPFLMDALALPGIAAKNSKGQWAMKDYELHAMGQLLPTLTDLRRLFPDEERYQERSVSTWISFVFGAGLRTNTKWEQDMERRSRAYEMGDEMKQERSLSGARL
jgi:hypothetical protein